MEGCYPAGGKIFLDEKGLEKLLSKELAVENCDEQFVVRAYGGIEKDELYPGSDSLCSTDRRIRQAITGALVFCKAWEKWEESDFKTKKPEPQIWIEVIARGNGHEMYRIWEAKGEAAYIEQKKEELQQKKIRHLLLQMQQMQLEMQKMQLEMQKMLQERHP